LKSPASGFIKIASSLSKERGMRGVKNRLLGEFRAPEAVLPNSSSVGMGQGKNICRRGRIRGAPNKLHKIFGGGEETKRGGQGNSCWGGKLASPRTAAVFRHA